MKKLLFACASLALVSFFAVSCGSDEPDSPKDKVSIALAPNEVSIAVGQESAPISVAVTPEARKGDIVWEVADKTIATFDAASLKVTGVKEGATMLTAKIMDKKGNEEAKAQVNIKVTAKGKEPEKITLSITPASLTLAPEETTTITVNVQPENAEYTEIKVLTSNPEVATITAKAGQKNVFDVKGIATGEATLTASIGEASATCAVKVHVALKGKLVNGFYFTDQLQPFDLTDITAAEESMGRKICNTEKNVYTFWPEPMPSTKDPIFALMYYTDNSATYGTSNFMGQVTEGVMAYFDKDWGNGIDLSKPLVINPNDMAQFSENEAAYMIFVMDLFGLDHKKQKFYRTTMGDGTRCIAITVEPLMPKHFLLFNQFDLNGENALDIVLMSQKSFFSESASHNGVGAIKMKAAYEQCILSSFDMRLR